MNERLILEEKKWLFKGETPMVERLKYYSVEKNPSPHVNEYNVNTRDLLFQDIVSGNAAPAALQDIINANAEDLVIGEIDRYGLPVRSVLNKKTGLIRTDPYYTDQWLNTFYSEYYRSLYSNPKNVGYADFFVAQTNKGNTYYKYVLPYLRPTDRILEIGCGMGGILVPFRINGYEVKGIDLGTEFVELGNRLNLNLATASIDAVIESNEKYDLVILSHLLEHIRDAGPFLEKLKRILTPEGKIFIAVPGIRTLHTIYKKNILTYFQNAHCWSFTQQTLGSLLNLHGFSILTSTEDVFCLATTGGKKESYDLEKEADNILKYLIKTEKEFTDPKAQLPELFNRGIRYLKRHYLTRSTK